MKAITRFIGVMAIVGAALAAPGLSGAQSLGTIRVRLVEGDAQMRIAETGEWAPVAVNTPILEGDALWIPDGSRVALQTSDGSHIRLGENTAFDVLRVDRDSFQFHLDEGHAYVMSRAPNGSVLQIDTPDASVRAFGKATFRVDVPDGETDVGVFRRSVLAESDAGTTKVRRGDMLVLAPDGYAELSPLPEPDAWERWNRDMDRIVLARARSTQHLPAELRVYSDDFDANGQWVYVEDYGYCWTPTVVVIGDWAPYRHGRWVWRGGDYVWIGYEPWGWAPYHYGRWTFVARIGWCWVPPARGDVFWGPGYVGWVRTPEYVAWVPLAPREIYYGHGNYGRHSMNVTNVNITNIRVTNVYRNVNVNNSVTVVSQDTFVTGRRAPVARNAVVNVREDFARRRNIVVGRPPIKPAGTSYVPVVRGIPEAKRPPAAVRKIDARQLRQARPLVKESDRSAIRPEAKPRALEVRKVEKARPVAERIRERRETPSGTRRQPGVPQNVRPGPAERGGRPEPALPQEPGRRERPKASDGQPPRDPEPKERPTAPAAGQPERERVRPQPPSERTPPATAPRGPDAGAERGRRDASPDNPAVRGRRDSVPAGRAAPSPPPKPETSVERSRRQEVPAAKPRSQEADDDDQPAPVPERRNERRRR